MDPAADTSKARLFTVNLNGVGLGAGLVAKQSRLLSTDDDRETLLLPYHHCVNTQPTEKNESRLIGPS
jgi:hypothetical protein